MTIFGDGIGTNNSVVHNGTQLDMAFNVIFGTLLSLSFPISFLLNPLVFYYNYLMFRKKPGISPALFLLLSLLDFILTLIGSVSTAYNLFKPHQDPLYDYQPTTLQRVLSFTRYIVGYTSIFITAVLCAVRYITIRKPFWAISHRCLINSVVTVSISIDFIWSLVIATLGNFIHANVWFSVDQQMIRVNDHKIEYGFLFYSAITVPFYLKIGISVILSVLTVFQLSAERNQNIPEVKRRSIKMIGLLNTGNVLWFMLCIIGGILTKSNKFTFGFCDENARYWHFYISFVDAVLAQCLIAAYNPLVICTRSTGIKAMLRHFMPTVGRVAAEGGEVMTVEET